ncbi:uracil-xanthine permease family protein [Tissierella carlieri]|jgi:uracil-xanthine permease|uniref:uracil-xanthine permease family protein n=1 Tax=Tissierella carlieri TaxID=689904 RepID=UPI00386390FC
MRDRSNTSKFDIDGIPPLREAVPLGLQHLLAMIVGNMVPAILIAGIVGLSGSMATMLIQGSMLVAGIATLIQLYPIPLFGGYKTGSRLPVIMGANYVFLGACLSVVGQHGIAALVGAQIIGAIAMIFFGVVSKKFRRFFTPVVSGTVVTCMGLGLFPTAVKNLAGGQGSATFGDPINFLVGIIVAVIIVMLMKFGKGLLKDIAILVGILVGYIITLAFNMVDFTAVSGAAWFALPQPLAFGVEFRPDVIITFILIYIIAIADIMGAYTVATIGGLGREVTDEELSSGVIGIGIGSVISSLFSSIPVGAFSQNAAIIAMNKVVSRFVVAIGTIVLILAGVSPKLGALITTIPSAVIGGATLVIFSQIAMAGVGILSIDLTNDNKIIAGVAIATSIGLTSVPGILSSFPAMVQTLIGDSSVVLGAIIAFILQMVFNIKSKVECEDSDKSAELQP